MKFNAKAKKGHLISIIIFTAFVVSFFLFGNSIIDHGYTNKYSKILNLSLNKFDLNNYSAGLLNNFLNLFWWPWRKNTCQTQKGSICSEYEVCEGRVLSVSNTNRCCKGTCELPKSFDWRNRHGENWNTAVKNQGSVPYCTQFGPVAAVEAVINLYYNQQLNIDLSEQILNSCGDILYATNYGSGPAGSCFNVNNPGDVICKVKIVGIPDENCYPYINYYDPNATFVCNNLCSDYQSRMWKIANFAQLLPKAFMSANGDTLNQELISEEKLKKAIIKYGPVAVNYLSWSHVMSIVGWEYDSDGKINWIIKNSWGDSWEEGGYGEITDPRLDDFVVGYAKPPVIPPSGSNYQIQCVDKDNDGFCNWGISDVKPSICPSSCKNEEDWDDSDSNIGALGLQAMTRGPIAPPTNLRITETVTSPIPWFSSVTWLWDSVPGASRYELYGGEKCTDFNNYGAITKTTHTMSGLNQGDAIYLKVKACNKTSCSDYSNCVGTNLTSTIIPLIPIIPSILTAPLPPTTPAIPTNLRVTNTNVSFIPWLSSITWSWDSVPETTLYELYSGQSCLDIPNYPNRGKTPKTSYTSFGFNNGDTSYLKIRACNDAGCSDYSNCVGGIIK